LNGDHIQFWDLEPGQQPDARHLETCEQCRRQSEVFKFLRAQLDTLPRVEAPPFFAARMANLIGDRRPSFVFYFERMAAQLAPLLTLLILVTSFLVYSVSYDSAAQARLVLQEAAFPEISVENLIVPPPEEDR
jgi:hypothetical protein